MASFTDLLSRSALSGNASSSSSNTNAATAYPVAIFLATISLLVLLLILAPFYWHIRNRNVGLAFFIGWTTILLFFTAINAIIWSNDNDQNWYNGVGLCDIEVKIEISSPVGFAISFFCVLRALAGVLDTRHTTVTKTEAQKKRAIVIDLLLCLFVPALQMVLHFVVQPNRYYVFGISGCNPTIEPSWLALVLVIVPPGICLLADGYLAALILVRLYRYRQNFRAILASRQTSSSRFLRLYLICVIWLLASTIFWIYEVTWDAPALKGPYSWSQTHDPSKFDSTMKFPSHGKVYWDRWMWVTAGILVFLFFGFGRDAWKTYKEHLTALGLGKYLPGLLGSQRDSLPSVNTTRTTETSSSRAKLLGKVKSWVSMSSSSRISRSATLVGSPLPSPKKHVEPSTVECGSKPHAAVTSEAVSADVEAQSSKSYPAAHQEYDLSHPGFYPEALTPVSGAHSD